MDKRTESAFLGKARHNLKNPVNAILGYSEMLIEDCEDEGLDHLVPDLQKLNTAGEQILDSIENIFNDSALVENEKSISSIAEEMELALRTPLNTIIGYSELLLEDTDDIKIDNFSSDINKINDLIKKIAVKFDLTQEKMTKCLNDDSAQDEILDQRIEAQKKYKIESTPTVMINEKKYTNKVDYKTFKKIIEKNL